MLKKRKRFNLVLVHNDEVVKIVPFGNKFLIKMLLDSPETLEVITKLRRKGFTEEHL